MKHSREEYEAKTLECLDEARKLMADPELEEQEQVDLTNMSVAIAQVYATLASAANDEHTHYYPHKLVAQLPWEEQPKAAREALRGVRKGKTTVTGEKLQHDGSDDQNEG